MSMKRKTLFFGLGCALTCTALTLTYVAVFANRTSQRVKGTDDFYSITINPSDVTSDSEYGDGDFSVYTDQLHNPINLKYKQAGKSGDYLYLLGNEEGQIYNYIGENSEIRGMNSITVKGGNSSLIVEYGFRNGAAVETFNTVSEQAIPAGTEYDFNGVKPNYFCIKSGSMSPSEIHQIVIKYGRECEAGIKPQRDIGGIHYSLREHNHWAVEGFSSSSLENVMLESTIDGLPVTEIWTYAFTGDTTIKSINLDNIVNVRTQAFDGCSNLSNIGDYSNITIFESYAFRNCDSLTGTLSFTAPSVSLYSSAFDNCDGITTVRIEDGCVMSMGFASFRNMDGLTTVYLGDSVSYTDNFLYDPSLATITVSEDSTKFIAIDNVLYEKDGSDLSLVRMAPARVQTSYVMPANVTHMDTYACHECVTLESLVINNNVGRISDDAFYGCTSLASVDLGGAQVIGNYAFANCAFSSITIPSSMQKVEGRAFIDCGQLTSVVFEEGCTQIAHDAFYACELLSSLILPASLEEAGSFEGGYGMGAIVSDCPSLAAICTRLTSGQPAEVDANWLGGKTLLYYSDVAAYDGAHWHSVGSNNAPRVWSEKLYIQSNAEFSGSGAWYAVWAWTKGQDNGAFYYDHDTPVDYLYSITVPADKNCFIVLRMKGGVDASGISSFPTGQFHNQTDELEDVLANQITITQWDNGMGQSHLGISYSLKAAA